MRSGNRQPLGIAAHSGRLLTANIHCPTGKSGGNPGFKDSLNSPLSVTADRCEK